MDVKKVEFHSHLALGDSLMVTCAVRDLKAAYPEYSIRVDTTAPHIWDYNPNITNFKGDPDMVVKIGPRRAVQSSPTSGLHYANGFRKSMEENLHISIPQGPIKPDIHLSTEEKNAEYIDGRYWIIVPGGKKDFGTKVWPFEYWQEVVNKLPQLTFVQVGETKHNHPILKGDNVINLVGYTEHPDTGIRDLFKLFNKCEGSMGLVSMHMHIAAAFDKACVVVAGAREPASFEQYNIHRYIHNQGAWRCKNDCENCHNFHWTLVEDSKGKKHRKPACKIFDPDIDKAGRMYQAKEYCDKYDPIDTSKIPVKPCWKGELHYCTRLGYFDSLSGQKEFPECILAIKPDDVVKAIMSYYEGGALPPIKERAKLKRSVSQPSVKQAPASQKPIFKMVCNAHAFIGGERSTSWILNAMVDKGYRVQLVPRKHICSEYKKNLKSEVEITNKLTDPCDIFMIYANDMVWDYNKEPFMSLMPKVQADKKILMTNFKMGGTGKVEWTKNFDLYGFLCTQMENDLLRLIPDALTFVLPPAVDIEPFLAENIKYNQSLHLVRHSSQGNSKYRKDFNSIVERMIEINPNISMSFMPGPDWKKPYAKVHYFHVNQIPVIEFLKRGTCYWYQLPEGYSDQGPRTIVEAMAIGLPCIADNRWGAKDRITHETGWLCDTDNSYFEIIGRIDHNILKTKGLAAKQRARDEFHPNKWIEVITS